MQQDKTQLTQETFQLILKLNICEHMYKDFNWDFQRNLKLY